MLRQVHKLQLTQLPAILRRGLRGGGPDGALIIPSGHARLFLGLNRRGGVRGRMAACILLD